MKILEIVESVLLEKPSEREEQAYRFFISMGLTPIQAAGIVGNLKQESSTFNTKDVGDGGESIGIAQWSSIRRKDFEKVFGKPFNDSTFQEQLQFIWWELNNTEKRALDKLKTATTAAEAAALFDKFYERSDGKARDQRSKNAEDIYTRYENPSSVVDKEVERRLLRIGVRGDDVEELQKKLNTAGYNIAVDGIFGNETLKALKAFQKQQGLTVDGIVGDNTYEVLDNITISDTGNTDGEIIRPQTRPEPKTTTKTDPEEFPGISPETKDAIDKTVKDVVTKSTIDKSTRDELNKMFNEPKKKTNKKPKGTTNKSPQVMTKAPKAPSYSAGST
jgi:peptidoglycan hydrolase-like protein with peptidoglycan-binding domain